MFKIIEKLDDHQVSQLMDLYEQCWWANDRDVEDVKTMLANSQVIGIIKPNNDLIGFARILTDGIYKAIILDVIVDKGSRGNGIGEMLLNAIISHPKIMKVKHLELYCNAEMIPFYQKWGFENKLLNINFMRKTV